MAFYVYMIQNIKNGKVYIGKTNDPNGRWKEHVRFAFGTNKRYQCYLHKAIKKYGTESFTFNAFQKFDCEKDCNNAEIYWISFFNTNVSKGGCGYNLTSGGEGKSGSISSQETRDKISKANLGRKLTEETKIKRRGENSNTSKLTTTQVIEIREKYQTLQYKKTDLAKEYNVSAKQIETIVKNQNWTNIKMLPYPGKTPRCKINLETAKQIYEQYIMFTGKKKDILTILAEKYIISSRQVERTLVTYRKFLKNQGNT